MIMTEQSPESHDSPLILLVEDNIIALHLVETMVTKAGCRFMSAMNGEKALELAKTVSFALIITDIGLPGISGTELTILIRAWEKSENKIKVPIIGLTANTLSEAEDKCLQVGMNKVLSKPIYLNDMQKIISRYIKKPLEQDGILENGALSEGQQLFALDQFPLFDLERGIKNISNERVLGELLLLMVEKVIPDDKLSIENACADKNWQQIADVAHKIKSGALYCGTVRMQYACHYLEYYCKTGQLALIEQLCQQLIDVLNDTQQFVKAWLDK